MKQYLSFSFGILSGIFLSTITILFITIGQLLPLKETVSSISTIFAGFLAVCGAVITVFQMKAQHKKEMQLAQENHTEALEHSTLQQTNELSQLTKSLNQQHRENYLNTLSSEINKLTAECNKKLQLKNDSFLLTASLSVLQIQSLLPIFLKMRATYLN